jgi:hypothetical protein
MFVEEFDQHLTLGLALDLPCDLWSRSVSGRHGKEPAKAKRSLKLFEDLTVVSAQVDLTTASPTVPVVGRDEQMTLGIEQSSESVAFRGG